MLLSQASNSGETLAVVVALTVMFGGMLLIVIVVGRHFRQFTEPRPIGQTLMQDRRRFGRSALPSFVEFAGRRFGLCPVDHQVREWLSELIEWWHLSRIQNESPIRLVRLRQEFRGIIAGRPIGGLVSCLSDPDRELRKLAIWLLGRCSGRVSITAVNLLQSDPDPAIRRHVAMALKRMGGWAELHRMATHDDDARVRRVGSISVTMRPSYSERLRQFVQHGGGEIFEPGRYASHMPVFMLQPIGPGKPAKPRDWIRRILDHIRQLVRFSRRDRAA